MTTANGFDPMAQYARLSERVENQGKDIVDLRSNMNTGFQTINSAISQLSNELRNNSKTQWPVIWSAAGVCSAMLIAAGTFVYGTLSSRQDRMETAFADFTKAAITRQEMEWRQARSAEDRARMDASIKEVRDAQVPREELDRVWQSYDQRFSNQQRQVDDIKQAQGSVYGARDILLDLRDRIDKIERRMSFKVD
ncbi:hypothetical protein [Rhizobium halophytocola]|uniref:DUF3618 domain-containing protein n=1 Tax=Rhizobium halophytocola TaxID=735519 RepID=A0ABS4E2E3_9HYPH|nr:hypothetical protein [Rhizobium halophytocola]MBP1852099.1 hypothetical protein [Rhizobium halophytocola]